MGEVDVLIANQPKQDNKMMTETETVKVDGVELSEGTNLWRYAALRTAGQKIGDQDPDEVVGEIAEQLVEKYPEAVNDAPVHIVKENLKGTPGIYDGSEKIRYNAMEVKNINKFGDDVEISIIDWKGEKRYSFQSNYDEDTGKGYYTFEPLSALEKHLGVTILPVIDNE